MTSDVLDLLGAADEPTALRQAIAAMTSWREVALVALSTLVEAREQIEAEKRRRLALTDELRTVRERRAA